MDKEEIIDKLHIEVELANKAKSAYEGFLKDFIVKKKETVYEHFCSANMDVNALLETKRLHKVVDNLESEIKSIIQTGEFAKQKLQQIEKETK